MSDVVDLDVYRSANVLIQQHGDEAPIFAAMKAVEFLEAGDIDACRTWKRIIEETEELLAPEIPDGATIQ